MTRQIAAAGVVVLALIGIGVWVVWPTSVGTPAWINEYDVTARKPDTIPPGTVIDQSAPAGWSHLVLKSLPRVRPEHRDKLNALTVRMSAWMFTAILADVRPVEERGGVRFHLRSVALGLGASAGGRDTIITPETAAQFGVELDWITREILKQGYKSQGSSKVVVHGPTFGLVDTPVAYRCEEKNRLIRFRYAFLVDGFSGRLDVLVWLLDSEGSCGNSVSAAILASPIVDEVELIPDMKEFNPLGIASDKAFGVDRLPKHRAQLLLPNETRSLAAQTKFTTDEASALETHLRRLLDAHH